MTAESTRNYVHVAFDKTTCPVAGCTSGKDKGPQAGSVPGIKRHVKLVHGEDEYGKATFPALRSTEGEMAASTKDTLFKAAQSRGLIEKDAKDTKFTKSDLLAVLAAGNKVATEKAAPKSKSAPKPKVEKPAKQEKVSEDASSEIDALLNA